MPVIMLAKGLQLLLEPLPAPRVQPARLLFSLSKWPLNSLTEGSVLCVFTWQAPWGVCCVKQQRWEQKQVFSTPPPTAVSPSTPALLPVPPLIHSFSLSFLPLLLFLHELLAFPSLLPPPPCPFSSFLLCVYLHTHPFTHALKAQHEFPFHLILANLSGDWKSGPHSWIPGWNHLCLSF